MGLERYTAAFTLVSPEQINLVSALSSYIFKYILISSSHLSPGLPSGFSTSAFSAKTPYAFFFSSAIQATCPSHLIYIDMATWTITS